MQDNKFDKDSLRLFSRIVADKKKAKIMRYGGCMEGETCFSAGNAGRCGVNCSVFKSGECEEPQEIDAVWIIEEHGEEEAVSIMESYGCFDLAVEKLRGEQVETFSEELKKIVRITKGIWPDENRSYICFFNDGIESPSAVNDYLRFREGVKYYDRPEFERCLVQMTGRPMVKDWHRDADMAVQSGSGAWNFIDKEELGVERIMPTGEVIGERYCITREEALERERIMIGTVGAPYIGEANVCESQSVTVLDDSEPDWSTAPDDANFWCPPGFVDGSNCRNGFWVSAFDDISFSYRTEKIKDWRIGEWISVGQRKSLMKRPFKPVKYKAGKGSVLDHSSQCLPVKRAHVEASDSDWFRNGDLSPVGQEMMVTYHEHESRYNSFNGQTVKVLGFVSKEGNDVVVFSNDLHGLGALIYRIKDKGLTGVMYPADFDINKEHQEAIELEEEVNIKWDQYLNIKKSLDQMSVNGRINLHVEVLSEYLANQGCTITNKKA